MLTVKTSALLGHNPRTRAMVQQRDRQLCMSLGSFVLLERSLDCLQGHHMYLPRRQDAAGDQ